jgi:cell fate (sporulation/competence/biofilm development) regulator YlbF (YheA/YmcA/DUF963 family)
MLRIDEDLFEIDALIENLVANILASPEAERYRVAKQALESDPQLQEELLKLQESADLIAFRSELRDLQKKVTVNPKVYQLKLAENDLQAELSALAKKLSAAVSENIAVDDLSPIQRGGHHQHRRNE